MLCLDMCDPWLVAVGDCSPIVRSYPPRPATTALSSRRTWRIASRAEMAPYLSRALCALALVAHASALALRAPLRAPLALGRRTALLRMALPASVMEFVPESVASDAAQMQQVEETWKVSASSHASSP